MSTAFGLDFGTTNSALSINHEGEVEVVDIDEHNITGKTLRSVLYFDEEKNVFVGQEAIEQYIESGATGRFMQSIKTFLPSKQFDYTYINKKRYELEDLIAVILRRIKSKGEEYVGMKIESVAMGRPVIFSEDPEKDKLAEYRLKRAAQKAGFKNIVFQLEPVAAALAFEKTLKENKERKVLIGDFGGGTSDFTVIKLRGSKAAREGNRKNNILSIGGVYVGGDLFDSEIMWQKVANYFGKDVKFRSMTGQWLEMPIIISGQLRHWHLIPQLREKSTREYLKQLKRTADHKEFITNLENLIEDNYGFMLFQSIEKAKIELSSLERSKIVFKERSLSIKEKITREEFENMISGFLEKIKKCVENVLSDAGLSDKDIDIVFITGGSSHVPCLKKLFVDKFGLDKIRQIDAFTSVAYGLGISASMYFD